ncbi:MAG: YggS family pyridoxal phosphate-dependent enzyme [Clostridia bacterium]|nr:YggS family pyridoxal phosphate-dependent enzyme [Clostridia bacterium]
MIEQLKQVISDIRNGNNLGEKITLVGATKTVDVDTINLAVENGMKVVAENKVQEFREKTSLIKNAEQQFIGHLQTNKVKYLVGNVSLIQSVDSLHLANEISNQAKKKNVVQNILVEVNVGGEISKSGINFDNAIDFIDELNKIPNVKTVGRMAMLPHSDNKDLLKSLCVKMRNLYDTELKKGLPFKFLSIGMSDDYKIAINNGSNMIRIGSLIFGKRNYGENK